MQPLISIIIPLYNREDLIIETLDSIASQTKDNWECIVVDDGSTDNSFEVASTYQQKDKRFKCIKRPRLPKGANTCRNVGADIAAGNYVCFLDSDDLLGETFIETRNKYILQHPEKDYIVFPDIHFSTQPNKTYFKLRPKVSFISNTPDIENFLKNENTWLICGPVMKMSFFKNFYFNEKLASCQEWDLFVRMLLTDPKYIKIDLTTAPDYFIRRGPTHNSISSNNRGKVFFTSIYNSFIGMMPLIKNKINTDKRIKKYIIKYSTITETGCLPYKHQHKLNALLKEEGIINTFEFAVIVLKIRLYFYPLLYTKKKLYRFKKYIR